MRINQLADVLAHVEPEWLIDCSGLQLKQVGSGVLKWFLLSYNLSYVLSSFRPNLVVFSDFYVQILLTVMFAK